MIVHFSGRAILFSSGKDAGWQWHRRKISPRHLKERQPDRPERGSTLNRMGNLRSLWQRTFPLRAVLRERLAREEYRLYRRRRDFYAQIVQPGDLCFDVGANVGNRVRVFRSLGARVVAVEPQEDLATYLRARFPRSTTVIEAGAGSVQGTASLRLSSSHTVASLSQAFVETAASEGRFGEGVRWLGERTVPIVTLDELIMEFGIPNFVKIDVEGYEAEVLRGLSRPVPCLSFEFVSWLPDVAEECVRILERLGDFRFCYSPTETLEWFHPQFTSGKEILSAARADGSWGDIYAMLL